MSTGDSSGADNKGIADPVGGFPAPDGKRRERSGLFASRPAPSLGHLARRVSSGLAVSPLQTLAGALSVVLGRYLRTDTVDVVIAGEGRRVVVDETVSARSLLATLSSAPHDRHPSPGLFHVIEGDAVEPPSGAVLVLGLDEDRVSLRFDTGALTGTTVGRLIGHLAAVLGRMEGDPDGHPATWDLLSEQETARLDAWNRTLMDYDLHTSLLERMERHIRKSPESVAAADGQRTITYAELAGTSDAVATALLQRGVGRGDVVALMAVRGVEALAAVVGIMKAGAAFLPLDQGSPPPRVGLSLSQGAPALCVAHVALAQNLRQAMAAAGAERPVLFLEDVLTETGPLRPPVPTDPNDLAYVLTTSGSTGTPKATMIEHRGMLNHALAMVDVLGLDSTDVVAQNAPLSFDISVWQMLTPLMVGGRVEFAPDGVLGAPDRVLDWAGQREVTVLQVVPSLMDSILQLTDYDAGVHLPDSLRWVIPTGEALAVDTARRWLQRFPGPPLLNAYGPAECSDDVTVQIITRPPDPALAAMPIGTPLPNVTTYVVDHHGNRAPVGVVGEIWVGGVGVGRGYRNDPDRTAAAFGDNPFPPYGRLYRTGDLGRFLEDGSLQYVGRLDHQVKIGGIRIEPGEVETVLRSHPAVREAVVSSRNNQLVAYFTGISGAVASRQDLRRFAAERLPGYMVPRAFVPLPRLPLNHNGKVDRTALPEPEGADFGITVVDEVGGSVVEGRLQEIWEDLLDVPVGRDDDFFARGGTSLLAAVMLWRVRRELGADLPISTPAEAPTIRRLARLIEDQTAEKDHLVPLRPGHDRSPLFLVPGQGGSTLGFVQLARHLPPGRPVWGLDLQRRRDEPATPQSFESLVDVYLGAMRSVQPTGPYLVGGWCLGGEVAYEIAQRLREEGDEAALVVFLQTDHRCYPRYQPKVGRLRRAWYALMDRASYERDVVSRLPRNQRATYVLDQIVMRALIRLRIPVETALARMVGWFGGTYSGSDEYHHHRWHRADGAAYRGHVFAPYSGDVLQIRARHQPRGAVPDPTLGWGDLVRGRLETVAVDGYHWNFLREPTVEQVAEELSRRLEEVDRALSERLATGSD